MISFPYARPESLQDALALVGEHGPDAYVLAGGTDLIVGLRDGKLSPGVVIDLKGVAELAPGVEEDDGALRISAITPMTDIIQHEGVQRHFPALVDSMSVVGSIAIRNRATLAGNICNASPAADTAPALLVHDAEVDLMSLSGTRRVLLDDFFVGPGQTVLQPGEIVTAISLPIPARPVGVSFRRLTRRRGVDLATASLCCLVDSEGGTTFAFGAVGPRPFLVRDATGVLADRGTAEGEREEALREVTAHARPISDVRATAEYRQAMLEVMSRRALHEASDRLAVQ